MEKKNIILITSSLTALVVSALFLGAVAFGYNFTSIIKNFNLVDMYYIFSILGVGVTLVAIGFAYYVPIRIADQQNKIALFEKRYELYSEWLTLCDNAHKLKYTLKDKYKLKGSSTLNIDKVQMWNEIMGELLPHLDINTLRTSQNQKRQTRNDDFRKRASQQGNVRNTFDRLEIMKKDTLELEELHVQIRYKTIGAVVQINKIRYLFPLLDKSVHGGIVSYLDSSYGDVTNDKITVEELKVRFILICDYILDEKLIRTIEEQLEM